MLRTQFLLVLAASFLLLGCVGMQDSQDEAPAQAQGSGQPEIQQKQCGVPEQHCSYNNVSEFLVCGSNYHIGGLGVENGSYYWVEACQAIRVKPNYLITITGPFESREEYDEYDAQFMTSFSELRAARPDEELVTLIEEISAMDFKGKPRKGYQNFLFTGGGTYPINEATSLEAVAERLARSIEGRR